eukprot:618981-Amphidinium_carterae.1
MEPKEPPKNARRHTVGHKERVKEAVSAFALFTFLHREMFRGSTLIPTSSVWTYGFHEIDQSYSTKCLDVPP